MTALWLIGSILGLWRDKRLYERIIPNISGFAKITVDKN